MTKFEDGAAKGQTLMLKRAARFLRVTEAGGKFDALDQLGDKPRPDEKLYAYEIVSLPGHAHINCGGGKGGFYPIANYRLVQMQPEDSQMRDENKWDEWCRKQPKRSDL